jgi:uncharacterized protein (TIGR02118 family)
VFQFTTVYYRVDDEEKLESFFSTVHLPLAEQLPGLVKSEVSRITGRPGGESRFHLSYSLYFATEQSFQLSMVTEAGLSLIKALKPWEEARLIAWFYADSFEEYVTRAGSKLSDSDLVPSVDNQASDAAHSSPDDAAGI